MNASTFGAPRRPTAGIDWANDDHAVAVVDGDGVTLKRWTVEHTRVGLRALVKALHRADVDAVGIERPDGPVVDTLLEAGFTVFVIAPNQVKNLRSRYGSAANPPEESVHIALRALGVSAPQRCAKPPAKKVTVKESCRVGVTPPNGYDTLVNAFAFASMRHTKVSVTVVGIPAAWWSWIPESL